MAVLGGRRGEEGASDLSLLSSSKGDFVDPCLGDLILILKLPRWFKRLMSFLLRPLVSTRHASPGLCPSAPIACSLMVSGSSSLGLDRHGLLISSTLTVLLSALKQTCLSKGCDLGLGGGRACRRWHRPPVTDRVSVLVQFPRLAIFLNSMCPR